MKIEHININDLVPYDKNAKKHPAKQVELLAENITRFGFTTPILIDNDNIVIAGHGRLEALKRLGTEDAPCVRMGDLTEEEVKALRLADNKIAEMGEWDMTLAIDELRLISDDLMVLTGFDLDVLIDPDAKDDVVPEVPIPVTKVGDLYQLGEHRLLCGDSTKAESFNRLFTINETLTVKADMVWCDPPYNVNYSGSGKNTSEGILNDDMSDEAFQLFLTDVFAQMRDHVKTGAGCYVFHSHKTASQFEKALIDNGFIVDTQLIWNKPAAGLGMNDYRTKHEPFFYCYQDKAGHVFYGDRTGTTVWKVPNDPDKALKWFEKFVEKEDKGDVSIWSMKRASVQDYVHSTQKPVELALKALHNSSKAGDIVLDMFLGSGTALIAAEKSGRICYGLELDPHYADVIVQRYVDFADEPLVILNGTDVTSQWHKTASAVGKTANADKK